MSDPRYSRQSLIPDWDQEKLKAAQILILGVGATGSYVATNLVQSGIGKLILVDYDTIEISNLNRQLLFRKNDVGKKKAKVAADRLRKINENVIIETFSKKMQKLPSDMIQNITAIACCLDTFRGRRWANSLAMKQKVPMVNGGMYAFLGDVQTILPYDTACFECQPLVSQEKLAQACTPLGEKRKDQEEEKEEVTLPSVSTLSSIIGGIMSQELIKLIIGVGLPIDNYLFYDGLHNTFTQVKLERNEKCPICGSATRLENLQALVIPNEKVKHFRERIALAFGLADPQLMIKGKFLRDNEKMKCNSGDKIYAIDERLATPIVLVISLQETVTEQSS